MRSRLTPLLIILVLPLALTAQDTPPPAPETGFGAEIRATAVEVVIEVRDAAGKVPEGLRPEDFQVLEDGTEQPVIGLERVAGAVATAGAAATPAAPATATAPAAVPAAAPATSPGQVPWQIVAYFDQTLSATPTVQGAAAALRDQADRLVGLGEVQIVLADPVPQVRLAATRDAQELRRVLDEIQRQVPGRNEIAELRRQFVEEVDVDDLTAISSRRAEAPVRSAGTPGGTGTGGAEVIVRNPRAETSSNAASPAGQRGTRQAAQVRMSSKREAQLLARQRVLLNDWLATSGRFGPRALYYVSDGFDVDLQEFYLSHVRDSTQIGGLQGDLQALHAGASTENLTQTLAAAGWKVFPISLSQPGAQMAGGADQKGRGRYRAHKTSSQGGRAYSASGVGAFLLRHPLDPLQDLAADSGGELLLSADQLATEVAALSDRVVLTYQVPRAPDGKVRRLDVRSRREDLTVTAPRFVAYASPDALAAANARRLLESAPAQIGDLTLQAHGETRPDPADPKTVNAFVDVDLDLAPLTAARAGLNAGELRATLAILLPDGKIFVSQQRPQPQDLSRSSTWRYRFPLRVAKGTRKVAVVVDDLRHGMWGGTVVELPAAGG